MNREKLSIESFKVINKIAFQNRFPNDLSIVWSKRLVTTAGRAKLTMNSNGERTSVIELSTKVCDDEERLRSVLLHEMCHSAAWLFDGISKPPHGKPFQKWCKHVSNYLPDLTVTTCHNYDIYKPHQWQCTNNECGKTHSRHSKKGIDISKNLCGFCSIGQLQYQGSFSRDGQIRNEKKVSAFRYKELLNHLKLAHDEVRVITTDVSANPPDSYEGYPITNLEGVSLVKYPQVKVSFDIKFKVGKTVKEFKPDLIHVSTPSVLGFVATFWSKVYGIPIVMSYHTHMVEYVKKYLHFPGAQTIAKFVIKTSHNLADLTLCTSPQLIEHMIDIGVNNVDLWPKGINTNIFSSKYKDDIMRAKLSQGEPHKPLLIYVGRLGPAEEELKILFKDYPQVYFAGEMRGVDLSQAFASSDIFVMPSDTETLGFVVLEAMASSLPVVAVAAGGIPDIITHNVTGVLASNDDNFIEFAKYTKQLIDNPELRITIGSNARKWAEQWSWEAATSKLRNIHYRKAIKNKKSSHDSDINTDILLDEIAKQRNLPIRIASPSGVLVIVI
eukprot:gene22408-29015_t